MVNIILISHGVFCEGLLSSLKMIAGDEFGVRAVPLFPGETVDVYREKLGKALDETAGEDGTLVLADIMSGTPYQSAAYLSKTHKIGGMGARNDRSVLYKNISTSAQENEEFKQLLEKNVNVFIQVMPQDKPVSIAEYLKK